MIYSTATVPVNPEGETPLTRAQAWKGLVLKARDARQFLPPNLCTVVRSWRRARRTSYVNPPAASLYVERNKIAIKYILISI